MRKIGRILLITSFLFNMGIASAQDFWQHMGSCDTALFFDMIVDPGGRIFLGDSDLDPTIDGGLLRSDDDGLTWQVKTNGIPHPYIRAITVKKDSTLFVSADYGVYRTYNLGENWQWMYDASMDLEHNAIQYGYDSILLLGGGREKAISRSTDDGETWSVVLNLYNSLYWEYITDIIFGPNNVIYACSTYTNNWSNNNPKVYYSTDFGITWSVFWDPETLASFETMEFDNVGRLLVGGYNGIDRYDLISDVWDHIGLNTRVTDILVVPDNRIYLACDPSSGGWGGVVASEDGGNSYTTILNSGLINGDARKFAVDRAGRILMITSGQFYRSYDTIFTSTNDPIKANKSNLSCYPNPFGDFVTFKSQGNENLNIGIYSNFGKIISTFEIPPCGEYRFDASFLSPGIYIAKIDSKHQAQTLKLVHY